jgi:thymidylate synthase
MEQAYLSLLEYVLSNGLLRSDRTGVGTISAFGHQLRGSITDSFPLLTTKKIHFKSVAHELLWFIKGQSNIGYLKENGVTIWDEWANDTGELGPVYGVQWRYWPNGSNPPIDQLQQVIEQIKHHPDSRRIMVSAWNPTDIPQMALPPCHVLFQFYVANGQLSCHMYQRSADLFLGVPFNIASYALLTYMIASITGLQPGELIISFGDVHIYSNHVEQVKLQLTRTPNPAPQLNILSSPSSIDGFKYEDFDVVNYQYHPGIPAPIAI